MACSHRFCERNDARRGEKRLVAARLEAYSFPMKRILIAVLSLTLFLQFARAQETKSDEPKKSTHLTCGKPHPNEDFTAVVFSSKTNLFEDLTKLAGKTVEVSGKVEAYHDKPQIVLNEKKQLKVIEEKADAKSEKSEPPKSDK